MARSWAWFLADTLKRVEGGVISETVPRRDLWRAQTPQVFRFAPLLPGPSCRRDARRDRSDRPHRRCHRGRTRRPQGCHGGRSGDNPKITTAEDLQRASTMENTHGIRFRRPRLRTGQRGHVGGISIPHDHALGGHSDADVALHALTDAVLGSIGAGDIGTHFPPSEPAVARASSDRFLIHAVRLLASAADASSISTSP